ncbi:MAG: phosphoribosyl-ATP diphosphatase [Chitinophagaceae bacterium]|nr:MAG: phosphoribosyl-ATP diphosphatase [Chitinophagaceae bacterium]
MKIPSMDKNKIPNTIQGLWPVIIQDYSSGKVIGYEHLDNDAFQKCIKKNKLYFLKNSKITTPPILSGKFKLKSFVPAKDKQVFVASIKTDESVVKLFNDYKLQKTQTKKHFIDTAMQHFIISKNEVSKSPSGTMQRGLNKLAQKFGEEAFELVIEAKENNSPAFRAEAADVLYYFLALVAEKKETLEDIFEDLKRKIEAKS